MTIIPLSSGPSMAPALSNGPVTTPVANLQHDVAKQPSEEQGHDQGHDNDDGGTGSHRSRSNKVKGSHGEFSILSFLEN